ncbi:hypothetical protein LINPERPRIM_LOCUS27273, partial [Linum perenne]
SLSFPEDNSSNIVDLDFNLFFGVNWGANNNSSSVPASLTIWTAPLHAAVAAALKPISISIIEMLWFLFFYSYSLFCSIIGNWSTE